MFEFPLNFVPKGPIDNKSTLDQVIAWHRPDDKPLSEPMLVSVLMHIWCLNELKVGFGIYIYFFQYLTQQQSFGLTTHDQTVSNYKLTAFDICIYEYNKELI